MKKLLLILFSLMLTFNSYGEWKSFGETPYGTWYVQTDSIEESDGYVYYELLRDFPKVDKYGFLSNKILAKGDCELNQANGISGFMSTTPMGNGPGETMSVPDKWTQLDASSEHGQILKWVCDFFNPSNDGSSKVINIDGENITFPAISSLVFAPPEMLEFFNTIQKLPDEMSFAYITPEDLEIWNKGEVDPNFAHFVQIRTRPNNGKNIPYSTFQKQVNSNKKGFIEVENTLNEVNAFLAKNDVYISNLAQVEMTNVIDAFIPYPAFIDNLDTFAVTILAIQKKTVNGEETRNGRIMTDIVIYIKDRILIVNFYSNLSQNSSIASQEEKVKDWLESLWKVNEVSKQIDDSKVDFTDAIKAYKDDDFKKAMSLFKPAAEAGNSIAQFYVGKIFYFGNDDILLSYEDAGYWFKKSIEKDNVGAYVLLGWMYMEGMGVLKNPKKAFDYYEIGAKSENGYQVYAQLYLGEFYIEGLGTEKNPKQGAYWINKAYNNPLADDNEKAMAQDLWEKHKLWAYE